MVALDVKTGQQIWKTYTIPERPRPVRKNSAGTQLYGPSGCRDLGGAHARLPARASSTSVRAMAISMCRTRAPVTPSSPSTSTPARGCWSTQLLADDQNCGGDGTTEAERAINCPGHIRNRNDDVSGSARPVHAAERAPDSDRGAGERKKSRHWTPTIAALCCGSRRPVTECGHKAPAWAPPRMESSTTDPSRYARRPVPPRRARRFHCDSDETGAMVALRPATGERVWSTTHAKPTNCSDPEASLVQLGTVRGGDGHPRRCVRRGEGRHSARVLDG